MKPFRELHAARRSAAACPLQICSSTAQLCRKARRLRYVLWISILRRARAVHDDAREQITMAGNATLDRGRIDIREDECKGCGLCVLACPPEVITLTDRLNVHGYHPANYLGAGCTGCGICFYACPEPGAITVYTMPAAPRAVPASASSPAPVR
jgi:2-oxoglutarate ferredoxin oxidoreductase subunit delta